MTSPSNVLRRVVMLAALGSLSVSICGCGPDAEERRLESDVVKLERDRNRLRSELATYNAIGEGEAQERPMVLSTVALPDLERALRRAFPIQFPASKLSSQVSGNVVISQLRHASLREGIVRFQLSGRGQSIKLRTAVPPGYQTMARELVEGLTAGLTLDVEGQVYVEKGVLYFAGRVRSVKLKNHAKKNYHDLIVSGVNGQLFNRPHPVKFDRLRVARKNLALKGVVTETNRFVFVFK